MTVTTSQVIQALREVVAEQGEDHTAECKYREHGQAECIVGHVFFKLGGKKALNYLVEGIPLVNQNYQQSPLDLNIGGWSILQAAQEEQDAGMPWGEALSAAELTYDDYINAA